MLSEQKKRKNKELMSCLYCRSVVLSVLDCAYGCIHVYGYFFIVYSFSQRCNV